ncbi:RsmB/NOP family class I SAM-dependent RNA methyltransferase [Corynebacterium variabile]|uniref:RsmB/NOP family class I SAM-dependent RNA methyltransferase n=1 Tax=Corynebacterium variabile TaxID=1727 RepID=UPI001D8044A7|nr:transcription antitermination factor NusB [Corynebacterium variabile]HJG45292.1 rRNA small subunit methyltransferase B [Corynebacterium variabile]
MGGFRSRSESGRTGSGDKGHDKGHDKGQDNRKRQGGSRGGGSKGYERRSESHRREHENARRRIGSGDRVRDIVFEVLRKVSTDAAFANIALPAALREQKIHGRDAAFATELTYGTLRMQGLLDAVIAEAAGRPVDKIDAVVLDALRLGAYQILRTRVDDHAAVNTTVELVKANGEAKASGFTNGVLRTLTRTPAETWESRVTAKVTDPVARLALQTSHPTWIAEAFNAALGGTPEAPASELADALAADDARPVVHLAARPGQISGEELALVTGGDEGRWSPYAVYLPEGDPGALDPVRDGLAGVQDEGSQLIALAMLRAEVADDHGRWLDLCSGPGGKTAFLASWAMGDRATVDAVEPAAHRAKLVRTATNGLPVRVHEGDGRHLAEIRGLDMPVSPEGDGFDRVLVDAPCTGLGALRRRPEARWRKTPADAAELVPLQKDLLRSALKATRPGGIVVYSTCSPHPAETRDVVRAVADQTGAVIEDATALFPDLVESGTLDSAPFVQLWPHRHGTDAMFFAVLRVTA